VWMKPPAVIVAVPPRAAGIALSDIDEISHII